jgi:predicted transcriptional regulator
MRTLGLKTQMIKEDIQFLLDAELLVQVDEPEAGIYVYKTTEKGRGALEQFYKLVTQFFTDSDRPKSIGVFAML